MHLLKKLCGLGCDQAYVPREKQIHGPIHHYAQLPLQSGKLEEIHRPPDEPGNKPGESKTHDLRHRGAAADRGKLPKIPVRERSKLPATQMADQIMREKFSLALRELGQRR